MTLTLISFNKESLLPKLAWKIITYQQDRRQTYELLTAAESKPLVMAIKRQELPFFHSLPEIKFFLKIGAQLSCWEFTSDNLKMSLKQIDLERCTEAASSGGGGGAASTSRVGWPGALCTRGSSAAHSTWVQIHVHTCALPTRAPSRREHREMRLTLGWRRFPCRKHWLLLGEESVEPWNKPAHVARYFLILT